MSTMLIVNTGDVTATEGGYNTTAAAPAGAQYADQSRGFGWDGGENTFQDGNVANENGQYGARSVGQYQQAEGEDYGEEPTHRGMTQNQHGDEEAVDEDAVDEEGQDEGGDGGEDGEEGYEGEGGEEEQEEENNEEENYEEEEE